MYTFTIALKEVKTGFRNPWAYSFLILFSLFNLSLLLIHSQSFVQGYSNVTGSMLNLILYLLPLMTLLLGSFSITAEKEEGSWQLISTYPIGIFSFICGKYLGLAAVLLTIISFGFGLTGIIGTLFGTAFQFQTFSLFFAFSVGLVLLFLAIALWIGTLSKNRWQALTFGVSLWFFLIIGWPTLIVALLGMVPYVWIKPLLIFLTCFNPAELIRLFILVKLSGGSILGPEYFQWVQWIRQPSGTLYFLLLCLLWIGSSMGLAIWVWERSRWHD